MSKASAWGERPKTRYRTRNWREYDQELIARGDLTVWILPDLAWHAAEGTGRRRPSTFSDVAIQVVLMLKVL
ncbi:transposase [Roseomonas mucosa]|uniref:transposase n=1 Tax=Roseomonas mucosa TaxID=207340 RepID=UPI0028CC9D62|nr:transposase [Roseomonas mucosa]MDT8356737.1 transposase [Roseomonas mucosa]